MDEIKRIVVQSNTMGNLVIKRISKEKAKSLIIENHYSNKLGANHGLFNYGIFRENKEAESECLGVAVYGYMMHPKARHFTHPNPQAQMLELNRMWISDELGKNAETILISRSLRLLRKDCPNTKFCRWAIRVWNYLQGGELPVLRASQNYFCQKQTNGRN